MMKLDAEIVIVGGGPVGLYLAGRLVQHGITCKVLEKRTDIDQHSKSLGIHPVTLELFEKAGIVESFLNQGLKIQKGVAFWNTDKLGEISFENCLLPFNYILAIPQWKTETILENWVQSLDETTIIRGADVSEITQTNDNVQVHYKKNEGNGLLRSRYLLGCDGKNSLVRKSCNIEFKGEAYPDCYMMGDFEDNTNFGSDAAVYLHEDGLIESFPLPNDQRRWVVKTDGYIDNPKPSQLTFLIKKRIQHHLEEAQNFMISSFGVQQYSAKSYHSNNILLAGDSAHVVSPIGGQGMNLGWLDAEEAVNVIIEALKDRSSKSKLFQEYSNRRRTITKQVAKRAEMNMHLGRKETSNLFYKSLLKVVLNTRLNRFLAHMFTMRGLGRWWI
ncbi:MAG: NAD(P)-binding protein [Bacteroidetes bacterium]|jgi:2-polyprenyl-6-methoxyphenol hydroxylase-like FAD-dependent oxidoreductase|nr:NAD(P)-binding protein [Bacteroidota bacterium]